MNNALTSRNCYVLVVCAVCYSLIPHTQCACTDSSHRYVTAKCSDATVLCELKTAPNEQQQLLFVKVSLLRNSPKQYNFVAGGHTASATDTQLPHFPLRRSIRRHGTFCDENLRSFCAQSECADATRLRTQIATDDQVRV